MKKVRVIGVFLLSVMLLSGFVAAFDIGYSDASQNQDPDSVEGTDDYSDLGDGTLAGSGIFIYSPKGEYDFSNNLVLDFRIFGGDEKSEFVCAYSVMTLDDEEVSAFTSIDECSDHNVVNFNVPGNGDYKLFVTVHESSMGTFTKMTEFSVALPVESSNGGQSSGSSSSSSRGGGSCITSYTYTEWTGCIEGFQIRSAYPENSNCVVLEEREPLVRECDGNEQLLSSQVQDERPFFSRITGAVIGPGGRPTLAGIVLFLAVLAIAYFVVSGMRGDEASPKKKTE